MGEMTEDRARAVGAAWLAAGGGWTRGALLFDTRITVVHVGRDHMTVASDLSLSDVRCVGGVWQARTYPERKWGPAARTSYMPDPRSPATLGGWLAVVRERWGDPGMFARRSTSRGLWRVSGSDTRSVVEAETEAEALVAALEAAPKAGS